MFDSDWWTVVAGFFLDEGVQDVIRVSFAVITGVLAVVTFHIRLKDRRRYASPVLATNETTRDARTGFPIYPLPTSKKMAPFPFIAPDRSGREPPSYGWLTVTEIRIWNAGKGIIFGPYVKKTSVAELHIPHSIGDYEIRFCASNDREMNFRLGRVKPGVNKMDKRVPVGFDFMPARAGILISIWHNAETGDGLRLRAFSEQTQEQVVGSYDVFSPRYSRFMSRITDILVVPAVIATLYMAYEGNTWLAVIAAFVAWSAIYAALVSRTLTWAPDDLSIGRVQKSSPC